MTLEDAIKWLENLKQDIGQLRHEDLWHYEQAIYEIISLLKEQEAKTGHWIYLQYCANEGVYCSECHTKMFDRYPMKKKLSQFCGHCGAKMEG